MAGKFALIWWLDSRDTFIIPITSVLPKKHRHVNAVVKLVDNWTSLLSTYSIIFQEVTKFIVISDLTDDDLGNHTEKRSVIPRDGTGTNITAIAIRAIKNHFICQHRARSKKL
ncbi:hypothetical protein PV325_014150 [Microctonus aethiopoides]|uniref:Uncharacterized protein n=1 Tax=Microctonus aethiopoides TaxID=144406 RepID=A0AA39KKY7_9HYME|nr:hypothetical protein PV325_014150 [Microctonus aethiopoides]KAK0165279.1 hypothetical protein PV328_003807 [Microctonus aethiopoides]